MLKALVSFHMERINAMQTYRPDYGTTAWIIRRLSARVKRRPKSEVVQLGFIQRYKVSFVKPRCRKTSVEVIESASAHEARGIVSDKYGKVKIKRVIKINQYAGQSTSRRG